MFTKEVLIGQIDNYKIKEKMQKIAEKLELEKVYSINISEKIYQEASKIAKEILRLTNQFTINQKRAININDLKKIKILSDNYTKKYKEFPELNPEESQRLSANIKTYIELEEALFKTIEFTKQTDLDLLKGTKCFSQGLDQLLDVITNNKNYIPNETLRTLKKAAQEIAEDFIKIKKDLYSKIFDNQSNLEFQKERERLQKTDKEIVKTSKAIVYEIEKEITRRKNNKNYSWEEEEKKLNELLENMEEWSKQKYTDEEKEAFERVMARLNKE